MGLLRLIRDWGKLKAAQVAARHVHRCVDGYGMMGDAVICIECGLCKYPEVMSWPWYVDRNATPADHKQALERRAAREDRRG